MEIPLLSYKHKAIFILCKGCIANVLSLNIFWAFNSYAASLYQRAESIKKPNMVNQLLRWTDASLLMVADLLILFSSVIFTGKQWVVILDPAYSRDMTGN